MITRMFTWTLTSRWFWRERSQGARWHSTQSFGRPFHSKISWAGTVLIEDYNKRNCVLGIYIEMKCTVVRFPTYVTGSSLAEIVKIENTRISNEIKSDWLLIRFTLVTKSSGYGSRYRELYVPSGYGYFDIVNTVRISNFVSFGF